MPFPEDSNDFDTQTEPSTEESFEIEPSDADDEFVELENSVEWWEVHEIPKKQEAKVYTEEELKNRLKEIKDINELKKVLEEIVWSMESKFRELTKKYDKDKRVWFPYDWRGDLDDDLSEEYVSVFEKKWISILQKAQDIMDQIEEWNAEANLLTLMEQSSTELFQLQKNTEDLYKKDIADWALSMKDFIQMRGLSSNYDIWWSDLFNLHNKNINKFKETISKKQMSALIWEVFSISEWAWAFNDWYKEIRRRLNWKSIFQEIDDIAANGHDREIDWTADVIEMKAIRGLFKNGKISDFDKDLISYKDAERIKQKIRKELRMSVIEGLWTGLDMRSFLSDVLTHFSDVKASPILWDIATELENTNPIIKEFDHMREELHTQEIDIMKEWRVNWLILFDNDKLEWSWASFFEPNINKYKSLWYTEKKDECRETPDMKMVTLENSKNKKDKITLVLLKEQDSKSMKKSYERAISELKDNWYNLFALRGHCFNTGKMASLLWESGMVNQWSLFIDWGCWNSWSISSYMQAWINCPMFTYTNTWKWETTEALFDLIIREKNSWWNLGTLLSSVAKASNQKAEKYQHLKTMNMPDSPYSLYAISRLNEWGNGEEMAYMWSSPEYDMASIEDDGSMPIPDEGPIPMSDESPIE